MTKNAKTSAVALNDMKSLSTNKELAEMYNNHANKGTEEVDSSSLPWLSVYTSTSKGELEDGGRPELGDYFHSTSKKSYHDPLVRFVSVKRREIWTKWKDKPAEKKWHWLVAGVIEGTKEIFAMDLKGISYMPIKELMDETRPYRKPTKKSGNTPIPIYCMTVQLGSDEVKTENGWKKRVIHKLIKNDHGFPILEADTNNFKFLSDLSDQFDELLEEFIMSRSENPDEKWANEATQAITGETVEPEVDLPPQSEIDKEEDVSDEIPF